jgi:hypothetical protein
LYDDYEPGQRGYLSRGLYTKFIGRYLQYFRRDQLLILLFDDLVKDSISFYKATFRFLEVEDDFECSEMREPFNLSSVWDNPLYNFFFAHPAYTAYLPKHVRGVLCSGKRRAFRYPAMGEAARRKLVEFYKQPNKELSELIGRNLDHWNR